jgi:hypothetical protein
MKSCIVAVYTICNKYGLDVDTIIFLIKSCIVAVYTMCNN